MLETIAKIYSSVNNFIWSIPTMICIIDAGIYLSIRTRFVQVRKSGASIKTTIGELY